MGKSNLIKLMTIFLSTICICTIILVAYILLIYPHFSSESTRPLQASTAQQDTTSTTFDSDTIYTETATPDNTIFSTNQENSEPELLATKDTLPSPQDTLKSYEDIYNEYSDYLRAETPKCIDSFLNNAPANNNGLTGLAELANSEVEHLAEICNNGISEMAAYMFDHGNGKYDEYESWAGKIMDVYQECASTIYDTYTNYAMNQ